MEASLPADETARLEALRKLGVLYTPAEERFDRITRLARRLLDVPIALISLVGSDCQWFKSSQGLRVGETSRTVSFCAHAILDDQTMVVPDAAADPRFADNALVVGEPYIRFYAGHPLVAADGSKLGTLCVIDSKPRQPSESDLDTLQSLAHWVENELSVTAFSRAQVELLSEIDELRRKALIDDATRLWNRRAIAEILRREFARAQRDGTPVALIIADIDHFKTINDTHGHVAGDTALSEVANRIRAAVRPQDAISRYGGEEFLIFLGASDEDSARSTAERIRRRVAEAEIESAGQRIAVTISLGVISNHNKNEWEVLKLIRAADKALYRAKAAGRNRVEMGVL